jgi:glycosyltransferase involved in cell wall biosynthesis
MSALAQTEKPDEIIVADDGSKYDTQKVIEEYQKKSHIPIIHAWQEDRGFRAAKCRNLAISMSVGEYIVLTDGDMILHKNFIEDHKSFAKKGFFTQGSRVLLDKGLSEQILNNKKINFSIFNKDIKNHKNALHSTILSKFFSGITSKISGIKTCNMAFFRDDCYSVNGFNEDFIGWGREDTEFAIRLLNKGIKRQNLRFRAIAYHIWHHENSRTSLEFNDEILEYAIKNKLTKCKNGLTKV